MTNRYLLDTGVVGAYLSNDLTTRRQLKGRRFFISIIVVGELYHGAYNAQEKARSLNALREFLQLYRPLPLTNTTGEIFGTVATALRGKTIPHNDLWIASQALQYRMMLVTFDSHFERIPDLKLEKW